MNGSGKNQQSGSVPNPTHWNWLLWTLLGAAVIAYCVWRSGAISVGAISNPNGWKG